MIQCAETDLKQSEQKMVSGFWEVQKKSESATKSNVMKIVIEEILPSRPNRFANVVPAPSEMSQSEYSLMSKYE